MRVLIAEDDALLREGIALLLTGAGHRVCAALDSGPGLLRALIEHRPEIAVLDVRLPPTYTTEGLRAAVDARRQIRDLPVLILSHFVERTHAAKLLADGACGVGYLLKDRVGRVEDFLHALDRVAAGGTAMDPEVIAQLMASRSAGVELAVLSGREREVLALMAEGRGNEAIADTLHISKSTVHKHVRHIFARLGLPTSSDGHPRVQAVLAYLNK